uniref:Septin-type G domain-containing protein n=1 Tax=Sparus aurata TaxID=8175 RepID=A0A671X106_SPAAU
MQTMMNYLSISPKRLADAVKAKSSLLKQQTGCLPVYKVKLKDEISKVDGCRRFSFGKDSTKHNRTIMVLGATGAGKSTLINGMINYILGVEWEDSYRFKLVDEDQLKSQAHSQTSEVTVYKINHQEGFKIEYSLTIVDTPGFGDTRGIERDRMITEQLRNVFSSTQGVSEIDAICFVAQASLARLTPTQKYVFDSVLAIFGKDVAENIRILVTFADGKVPPVLEAIKASGVPCPTTKNGLPIHFKFNNSVLFAGNEPSEAGSMRDEDEDESDNEDGSFDKMFWDMGIKSMKKFFVALNTIKTKSLTMTKEVLRERKQLENSVENLQKQVKLGLATLEEIKETTKQLKMFEAEITANKNFEFEVTVMKPFQQNIAGTGIFLTNCTQCDYTCHDNCAYASDADKINCCAMESDGYCGECRKRNKSCIWSVHSNQKYKWEYREVKEKRTIEALQKKFNQAKNDKKPVEAMISTLKAEYDRVQAEVVKLMETSGKCLNRLKEIALKPDPLSTTEYIDMLIEGEKSEGKSGWKQRVQSLMTIRDRAETLAKIGRGEKLLHRQESTI